MFLPFVFGLNYQSASFDIREKIAFSPTEIPNALHKLHSSGISKETFILSTCNRTEIYCVTQDIDFIINAICDIQNICPRTIRQHSYIYSGVDCANHLFRVVSGLESMILGETEIVAQVKDAVNIAKTHNTMGSGLMGMFEMALSVEKDIRNKTEINNVAISMGRAIVNLITEKVHDLARKKILFIGAGQMMNKIAPHFLNIEFGQKTIVNRTLTNAQRLAKRANANALDLDKLPDIVNDYSVIVACCSVSQPILNINMFGGKIAADKPLLIIDLSMPLITDLELRKHANLSVLTIDDIAQIVDVGIEKRQIAATNAEILIDAKLIEYQNWQKKREISPMIKKLRDNAEEIRLNCLAIAEKQLQNGEPSNEVLHNLSVKLTNKLLHNPTVNLCAAENSLQTNVTELVNYLYDLK